MMNRSFLKTVENDILLSLKEVEKKHNVKIEFGSGSFTDSKAQIKMHIYKYMDDAAINAKEAVEKKNFGLYAQIFGLKPEHYHAIFKLNRTTYRLTEIIPSRPKFPFIMERISDGKKFKLAKESIPLLLNQFNEEDELEPELMHREE